MDKISLANQEIIEMVEQEKKCLHYKLKLHQKGENQLVEAVAENAFLFPYLNEIES